jgi:hypothetical protein
MPKFRKRPVIVEAEQFDGSRDCADRLLRKYASNVYPQFGNTEETHQDWTGKLCIDTLEGVMVANPGDWIITGVQNERYPCKDEIFRATYEPVDEA